MRKWIMTLPLILITVAAFADINSDIASCLSSGSTTAGSKASCVQNAFIPEGKRQIAKMLQVYADYANGNISYYGSSAGTNTPGGSTSGGMQTPSPTGGTNSLFAPIPKSQVQSPPPSVPGQSPGASTPVPQPRQTPGGIQYY